MNRIISALARGAVGFAVSDIQVAQRMLNAEADDDTGRGTALRCKYATRRLESAKLQIDAAIALLRSED